MSYIWIVCITVCLESLENEGFKAHHTQIISKLSISLLLHPKKLAENLCSISPVTKLQRNACRVQIQFRNLPLCDLTKAFVYRELKIN